MKKSTTASAQQNSTSLNHSLPAVPSLIHHASSSETPSHGPSGPAKTSDSALGAPRKLIYAYGPKLRVRQDPGGPSLTKQEFKDECDINVIMAQYMKTGVLDFVSRHPAVYQDLPDLDYYGAMLQITEARSMFNELPASIRSRFENDPGQFLDFVHDPDNREEMRSMGLLRPDAAPAQNLAKEAPISPTSPSSILEPQNGPEKGPEKGSISTPKA